MIIEHLDQRAVARDRSATQANILISKPRARLMKPHTAVANRAVPPVHSSSRPLRRKEGSTLGVTTDRPDYLHQIISLPNIHSLNAGSSNHFREAGSTLKRGRDATKHPLERSAGNDRPDKKSTYR